MSYFSLAYTGIDTPLSSHFFGRDQELRSIQAIFTRADTDKRGVGLLVTGTQGVGKSTTINEALRIEAATGRVCFGLHSGDAHKWVEQLSVQLRQCGVSLPEFEATRPESFDICFQAIQMQTGKIPLLQLDESENFYEHCVERIYFPIWGVVE